MNEGLAVPIQNVPVGNVLGVLLQYSSECNIWCRACTLDSFKQIEFPKVEDPHHKDF